MWSRDAPRRRMLKHQIIRNKKPLQLAESELQSSETDVKKHNKRKRQQIDDDDDSESDKEEEEAPKKAEELATFECCFESEDSEGHYSRSVLVKGFDTCHSRDDIKTALWKHFESCGCKVVRVFVPIECKTGVPLGFAFVYVDDSLKAISLGCGYMGERHLRVMMAKYQPESTVFPNFHGCKRCGRILAKRRMRRFVDVNGSGGHGYEYWLLYRCSYLCIHSPPGYFYFMYLLLET
ncbi:hypothetical protein AALP_AA4G043800 [Arabis alpina]|uniref:RRM domain-containing protein n=1 Tax=Arabis alpina TaxID=50452 RepID=A0A087H137_ARAAL|nr:hypothetical protein AALP_AA4G043800 [Arabis alpina]